MSRPDITLTPDEQRALLAEPLKAALATVDADGFPHIVAMSFLARDDGAIYMTSYAKAQKVLNVRRNPKVAVMIETGQQYAEFHAVMVRGRCEVIEDRALVEETMRGIAAKRSEKQSTPSGAGSSAPKRVVLKIVPEKLTSWDHRKLGGRY
jgi:PPOX class probable F420-dependent enzyme